jgi:hypothetical protein
LPFSLPPYLVQEKPSFELGEACCFWYVCHADLGVRAR